MASVRPDLEEASPRAIRHNSPATHFLLTLGTLLALTLSPLSAPLADATIRPGTLDLSFDAGLAAPNGLARIHVEADGQLTIGNVFRSQTRLTFSELKRLNSAGTEDLSFAPAGQGLSGVDSQGRYFSRAGADLVRLKLDGSLDPTFQPWPVGLSDGLPLVEERPDGSLIAAASRHSPSRGLEVHLQALGPDGTPDPTFAVNFGGRGLGSDEPAVRCLVVQADGRVAVVPDMETLKVAGLDGALDLRFARDGVWTLARDPDGRLLVGGNSLVGGNGLIRLNPDGTEDSTFRPDLTPWVGVVKSLAFQPDGRILVGGTVDEVSTGRTGLVRLNHDGTVDPSFDPGQGIRRRAD